MTEDSTILEVQALSKGYLDGDVETIVLSDVGFTLHANVSMALTGPSGSGKSTLLNLLAGMLEVGSGEILLHPTDHPAQIALHSLNERQRTEVRRKHIGYIHQFFNLVPTLTVLENVQLPAVLNRQVNAQARGLALLEEFALDHYRDKFPHNLSGGEQQRVAVARALVHEPSLILADEPTGNLDAVNAATVAEMLLSAARSRGTALIIATHNEQIAERTEKRLRLNEQRDEQKDVQTDETAGEVSAQQHDR